MIKLKLIGALAAVLCSTMLLFPATSYANAIGDYGGCNKGAIFMENGHWYIWDYNCNKIQLT